MGKLLSLIFAMSEPNQNKEAKLLKLESAEVIEPRPPPCRMFCAAPVTDGDPTVS